MIFAANPAPSSATFTVRGHQVVLQKMDGAELALWGRLNLQATASLVRAVKDVKSGNDKKLRSSLRAIYFSHQERAGRAIRNPDLAANLSPLEQREIVTRQQMLQDAQPGQVPPATPVGPASGALVVADRAIVLRAMSGESLLDWAEIQVICAQEQIVARELTARKRHNELKKTITQLMQAEHALAVRAVKHVFTEPNMKLDLTEADRKAVVHLQDQLNQVDQLGPLLETYAMKAYLRVGL